MVLVTGRSEVVGTYGRLGSAFLREGNVDLPPFACRAALAGRGVAYRAPSEALSFTGTDAELTRLPPFLDGLPGIVLPCDVDGAVLEQVGLAGCQVVPVAGKRLALLQQALVMLREVGGEPLSVIGNFVSMVCWIRPKSGGGVGVSSTSFYEFPHCVFLSDLGARHIAPDFMLGSASGYALLDNLYHESLHQQLIATLRGRAFFTPEARNVVDAVYVPWRRTHWGAEHAVHALLVYSKVAELRARAASLFAAQAALATELHVAVEQARECRALLKQAVLAQRALLTADGREFCESL